MVCAILRRDELLTTVFPFVGASCSACQLDRVDLISNHLGQRHGWRYSDGCTSSSPGNKSMSDGSYVQWRCGVDDNLLED